MAAPTAYDSEAALAAFMIDRLQGVAGVLGWATLGDVQEAVNEALLAYGADTIAAATDVRKIRALAAREAWRAAVAALTTEYNFSRPDGSYERSQMLAAARANLRDAEDAAAGYDQPASNTAVASRLHDNRDPYVYTPTSGQWG